MEVVQFFFSGPQWFLHFICLLILCYAISPTIEKHYYLDGKEYPGDSETGPNSGRDKEDTATQDGSEVPKE